MESSILTSSKHLIKSNFLFLLILMSSCGVDTTDDEVLPPEEEIEMVTGTIEDIEEVNISINQIKVVSASSGTTNINNDGTFDIVPSNYVMAVDQVTNELIFITLYSNQYGIQFRNDELLLNCEETAIALIANSLPLGSLLFNSDEGIIEDLKIFLRPTDEVAQLKQEIQQNVLDFGYLALDQLEGSLRDAVNSVGECLDLSEFFVDEDFFQVTSNPVYQNLNTPYLPVNEGLGVKVDVTNSIYDEATGSWKLTLNVLNANPLYLAVVVGQQDPVTGEFIYDDEDISNLVPPFNTSAFYNTFTTCNGIKNYLTDTKKLLTQGVDAFSNFEWDRAKAEGIEVELKNENDILIFVTPQNSLELTVVNMVDLFSDFLELIDAGFDVYNTRRSDLANYEVAVGTIEMCNYLEDRAVDYVKYMSTNSNVIDAYDQYNGSFDDFGKFTEVFLLESTSFIIENFPDELINGVLCELFTNTPNSGDIDLLERLVYLDKVVSTKITAAKAGGDLYQALYSWWRINHFGFGVEADFDNDLPNFNVSLFDVTNSNIPSNKVTDVTISPSGEIWIATDAGIAKLSNGVFEVLNTSNSALPTNLNKVIEFSPGGEMWVGGQNEQNDNFAMLSKWNGGTDFTEYNHNNSNLIGEVLCIHFLPDNDNFFVGSSTGLRRWNGIDFDNYSYMIQNESFSRITSIDSDLEGNLWIVDILGANGVIRFKNSDDFTIYNEPPYFSQYYYGQIKVSPIDEVWAATGSIVQLGEISLYKLSETTEQFEQFANPGDYTQVVNSIGFNEESAEMWFGLDYGMFGIKDSDDLLFVMDGEESYSVGSPIREIEVDSDGVAWMASESGLIRVEKN